jgi:hypothetical protein
MIAATPVLVSTSAPLARTVRAAQAGVIFKAGSAIDCADKNRSHASDNHPLRELGESGRRYVLQQGHNWEEEAAPALIAAYDTLLGCRRQDTPVAAAAR